MLIAGTNRGARAIVNEFQDETIQGFEPEWLLVDPKKHRAVQFARHLANRFATLRPKPMQIKVQDALPYTRDDDTFVLCVDTLTDTIDILEARLPSQRVTFQLVGRGPGATAGTHIALQGTIFPGDHATESRALLFLQTLTGMSQAASSRRLTGDALSAAVLSPLRQTASRQTARHLAEKEYEPQDLSGGPLSIMFGPTLYPLIPVRGGSQDTHSHWEARALDATGAVPSKHFVARAGHGGGAMVAVVIPEVRAIHFLQVVQNRTGKRSVAGMRSFVSPRRQRSSQSAFFTD